MDLTETLNSPVRRMPRPDLLKNARVLVVDDNEGNVRYLERVLQTAGMQQVESTTDSRQALPLFESIDPDLVILDLMMPFLDGYQVLEQLKPCIPAGSYLPILVITADITPDSKRRALAAGARDFLTKPFDPVEVILRISNLLEIRFLYRELQNRIGRDIHDGPLQDLSVLLLRIEQVQREIEGGSPQGALRALAELRSDINETMVMMRSLVQDLRPPILDTLGLDAALGFLASRLSRDDDIAVRLDYQLDERLNPIMESVVYHLVQEALNNVRQHAEASNVLIRLEHDGDTLRVMVKDDGAGFDVEERRREALATGHIGLAGMHERARAAGGQLQIESAHGKGATVRITFPFRAA